MRLFSLWYPIAFFVGSVIASHIPTGTAPKTRAVGNRILWGGLALVSVILLIQMALK